MGYTTYVHNWIYYMVGGFLISGIFIYNPFLNLATGLVFGLIGDYYEWKDELYKIQRKAGIWELAGMAAILGLISIIALVIAIINGKVRI